MAPERPAFEIGFVLAGAISAGCYYAGVMDFIIEALDDYYTEREKPEWDRPRHDVYVPVLAGASAGGMTAGMAALHMFTPISHVWPDVKPPAGNENRLYSSGGQTCQLFEAPVRSLNHVLGSAINPQCPVTMSLML
ncbi:hypothetical protein H8A97_03575 [Bradyrhizobium sp. Arg62]|uniref:patatin-like phospholipase family protein n=1 Tax=Bradyrhizobium brasilense TaxID=1419277 RepID=UPI001E5DACEB|nr:patatin-like phospholipase family protein [Bradyrhizobium brasilense]MCC8944203.1 hypothetical protein [Bradyrhizobium brasilense]